MLITYKTKSYKQTQKVGEDFAKEILKLGLKGNAIVLGLQGNLGGGKTTFLQGFAKGLGIKEKVLSPTFVIQKKFGDFYHFDCYRIKKASELKILGVREILMDPENLVLIEWPERISRILPKKILKINFGHGTKENERVIKL